MAEVITIIKYGLSAYEYLKACYDTTCFMTMHVESSSELIFTAFDHRGLVPKMFSVAPWKMNFAESSFKPSPQDREEKRRQLREKVYKTIRVVVRDKTECRRLIDKYHGNDRIQQSHLIDYVKLISREGYVHAKLVETWTPVEEVHDSPRFGITYKCWDEYTLVYEIGTGR